MDTKKLRQKILDLAIRGKLVPQDPNDEPASVLLERIRAEKERLIKEGKIKRSKKSASDDEIEAPNGWVCCRFDEICSKFSTGPFGSMVHKSDYVSKDGTPIVNPMNIVEGKISTNNLMMVSNEKAQELDRYRLTKDDILIARRGDLRKCCIVTEDSVDWICGTGSFFLHVPFVEPRYIEFFYLSEYVQMILKRECVGATMDNLNQSVLGSIPFLLPPLSEQKRIVNAVERWFAVIDALESNEGDLLKAIDKAKSKILDLAIHGKLVPQDPNDEPAIDLLKRINPDFEACDEEDCPYTIPQNWEWTSLGILYNIVSAKRVLKSDWKHKGIPFYRAREIVKLASEGQVDNELFISKSHYEEMKTIYSVPNPSDIMMSAVGTIGKTYIVKENDVFYYKDASVLCLQNNNNMYSEFISIVLSSQFLQDQMFEQSKGTTVDTITIEKAKSYILPLPPIQEQLRIVAKIEELFSVLDSIKESLE